MGRHRDVLMRKQLRIKALAFWFWNNNSMSSLSTRIRSRREEAFVYFRFCCNQTAPCVLMQFLRPSRQKIATDQLQGCSATLKIVKHVYNDNAHRHSFLFAAVLLWCASNAHCRLRSYPAAKNWTAFRLENIEYSAIKTVIYFCKFPLDYCFRRNQIVSTYTVIVRHPLPYNIQLGDAKPPLSKNVSHHL